MAAKPRLRYYSDTIAAGATIHKDIVGEFTYFSAVTGAINVSLDGETPIRIDGATDVRLPSGDEFKRVTIENTGGATVTVSYYVGFGAVKKDSLTISGSVTTIAGAASTLDSKADVSITATSTVQVIAANLSRKRVRICNPVTNTQTMRIGDSGAGAANGDPLYPGGVWEEAVTDAVYAYNPGGSAESLSVVEVS